MENIKMITPKQAEKLSKDLKMVEFKFISTVSHNEKCIECDEAKNILIENGFTTVTMMFFRINPKNHSEYLISFFDHTTAKVYEIENGEKSVCSWIDKKTLDTYKKLN